MQQVYDDGDLKIIVCNTSWTYNPRAVSLLEDSSSNIPAFNSDGIPIEGNEIISYFKN